jgi:hypothetical protein
MALEVDHRHVTFDDGPQQTRSVAEVVLHPRRVALAGGLVDLAQRGSGQTPLGEEPLGRVQDARAARGRGVTGVGDRRRYGVVIGG